MSENEETLAEKLGRLTHEQSAKKAHAVLFTIHRKLTDTAKHDPDWCLDDEDMTALLRHHSVIINAIPTEQREYENLVYMTKQLDWWHENLPHNQEWSQARPVLNAGFTLTDKFMALGRYQSLDMANYVVSRLNTYRPIEPSTPEEEALIEAKIFDRLSHIMTKAKDMNDRKSVELAHEVYETSKIFFDSDSGRQNLMQENYVNHCIAVNQTDQLVNAIDMFIIPFHKPNADIDFEKELKLFGTTVPSLEKLISNLMKPEHIDDYTALVACNSALDFLTSPIYESYYYDPEHTAKLQTYTDQSYAIHCYLDNLDGRGKNSQSTLHGFLAQFPKSFSSKSRRNSDDEFDRSEDRSPYDPNAPHP